MFKKVVEKFKNKAEVSSSPMGEDCSVQETDRANPDDVEWFKRLMAHNIRMPLAIISGYVELLMQGNFKSRKEEIACIDKISSNVDYIDTLIKVLLDAEQESLLSHKEHFDLLECAEKVASYVKMMVQKAGVDITVVSSKTEIIFYGNRIALMRALFNLIENSLRYMKRQGNICITVEAMEEEILVIYRDDGEGMSAEEAEHVAEPNFRGSNVRCGSGTGMGMYLVREAVENQGGIFSVKSSPGNGMAIYMSFPKARKE